MTDQKKPTGVIAQARFTPEGFSSQSIEFPQSKPEIERFIAEQYVKAVQTKGVDLILERQNYTDDLDFNVLLNGAESYLELTEVANVSSGAYDSAPSSYNVYSFAQTVVAQIRKKSSKYKGATAKPIVLLLYVTDWKFVPAKEVVALFEFWMRNGQHGFVRIDWFCPLVGDRGMLHTVFPPSRQSWSGFNPGQMRNMGIAIADVRKPVLGRSRTENGKSK